MSDGPTATGAAAETPDWLSAYLFFDGWIYEPECDRIVVDVVEPFVRRCMDAGWADGHFFIRYSERGPHVRFRLHGEPEVLDRDAWPALLAHVREAHPDARDELPPPPEPGTPIGQPLPPGQAPRITHVARVPYEPEVERYGGPAATLLAERIFEVSSEAAFALLARTGTERSSRLGKGLLALVVLVHTFTGDRDRGAAFTERYGVGYLRTLVRDDEHRTAWLGAFGQGFDQQSATLEQYVDEVWERMDAGEELSGTLDRYREGMIACRDDLRALFDAGAVLCYGQPAQSWEQVVATIAPSYVHMMNNRLGVTLQEESYLAYLVTRALGRPVQAAGNAPGA